MNTSVLSLFIFKSLICYPLSGCFWILLFSLFCSNLKKIINNFFFSDEGRCKVINSVYKVNTLD